MNRLSKLLSLVSAVFVISIFTSSLASALTTWQINIAAPDGVINSRSFNIEFTTLSVNAGDSINVELFQNGNSLGSETTTAPYGDSGDFSVTVPSDGTYEYFLKGTNGAEVQNTETKTVVVDTAPTAPVTYGEVTRSGNTYTISFIAPSNTDIVYVRLFSSTSPNFTADNSTQVGQVTVIPGQTSTITYTATDGETRYHAVQAFDSAGNGSTLVGDPNIVVTQAQGLPGDNNGNGVNTANFVDNNGDGIDDNNTDGQTQGDSRNRDGRVDADGNNRTDDQQGEALGDQDDDSSSAVAWIIVAIALLALLAYANRERIAQMFKREK